ncbi:phenylacetaldoxime dehydratase family protein [Streptomyces sp. NBC_00829]|uniref:phenylacetaldoxime dehydratase family protein n=1 Tax=Streptomyces sp. NBC_00829 TaxID=2903679 RepID=UPI003862F77D|nr:phenylacetaldoxime dehydratase family protein [Streptomyces sp. NBC_00829]
MRKPEGHQPSYPAFTSRFPDATDAIVFAQLAVEGTDLAEVTAAVRELDALLAGTAGPRHLDRVRPVQEAGEHTRIALAYWDSVESYRVWWSSSSVRSWWESLPDDGPLGYWREVATIPVTRFESLHSGEWHDNGVSHFTPIEVTEHHDYWGGMRDRIRDSHHDELAPGEAGDLTAAGNRRIIFTNPDNLCFIRTAQDWSHCQDAERTTYSETVAPTLRAGADYIGSHPDTGCTSARYVQELDETWSQVQDRTCVLAWWLSLAHLEEWTVNHPTHQVIFGAFHQLLQRYEFTIDLRLWHEVCVLPAGAAEFEYVNCLPVTGISAPLGT